MTRAPADVEAAADAGRSTPSPVRGPGTLLVALEVVLAAVAVLLDLFIPTLVLLALAGLSLAVRRVGPSTLGLVRPRGLGRQVGPILVLVVAWTVVQLAVVIPVLEHLTGTRQDLAGFSELEGNLGLLLVLVVLSWTLAAFGEEVAYRGYVRTRILDLVGPGRLGTAVAVLASSALFAVAHSEQGAVGVGATFCDALFFSALIATFRSRLWAAVLAHGLNNTIGLTAYFLVGPIHGWW